MTAGFTWVGTRVLVTGATGLIGSSVVGRLLEAGAEVVAFVLDSDPRSAFVRSGDIGRVPIIDGALEDLAAVERAVVTHRVDTVMHLGAQTIVGAARLAPVATFEANIRGTWNVLEVCRRHQDVVRRVVVASSDKAYGTSSRLPYEETMPLCGREPYEVSKTCTDLLAQSYAASYGLPLAIARCGNVYGPGDLNWSRIVPGTLRSLFRGEQPVIRSDGTLVRDYLHVDDVAVAYLRLAESLDDDIALGEAYNLSDESPRTVLEIYEATCRAAGFPDVAPLVLGEAAGEIHEQYLSAEKARTALGWVAKVDLLEGLTRTAAWYRDLLSHG